MPLVYYQSLQRAEVGVWSIEEPEQFFYAALEEMDFPMEIGLAIRHPEKKLQWFASRYLLSRLYPHAITLVDGRKPYLFNGPHVSISHSQQLVAVMIGEAMAGVDLQWPDPKLEKVAPRFTSPEECLRVALGSPLDTLTAIWAIKEAVFKHYGTELPFRQIEIKDYDHQTSLAHVQVFKNDRKALHSVSVHWVGKTVVAFINE